MRAASDLMVKSGTGSAAPLPIGRFKFGASSSGAGPRFAPLPACRSLKLRSCFILLLMLSVFPASAHTLQYLAWFRVERTVEFAPAELRFTYDCRFSPAKLRTYDPLMDTDGDGTASQHEIASFCLEAAEYLVSDLIVMAAGVRRDVREESFFAFEDGSGFRSVIRAAMPDVKPGRYRLDFIDPAFLPVGGSAADDKRTTTGLVRAAYPGILLLDSEGRAVPRLELGRDLQTTLQFELRPADNPTSAPHRL
jgi:hypothetical protein